VSGAKLPRLFDRPNIALHLPVVLGCKEPQQSREDGFVSFSVP